MASVHHCAGFAGTASRTVQFASAGGKAGGAGNGGGGGGARGERSETTPFSLSSKTDSTDSTDYLYQVLFQCETYFLVYMGLNHECGLCHGCFLSPSVLKQSPGVWQRSGHGPKILGSLILSFAETSANSRRWGRSQWKRKSSRKGAYHRNPERTRGLHQRQCKTKTSCQVSILLMEITASLAKFFHHEIWANRVGPPSKAIHFKPLANACVFAIAFRRFQHLCCGVSDLKDQL